MPHTPNHGLRQAAALFAALTLIATYPIARAPGSYAYFDHPDAQLNMWIIAWDAHALRHDPLNLFNANIFYPAHRTLAYSETLLGYLPLFGPILWLSSNPVLAFNIVLLFSFVVSALGMYLLTRHLTGSHWAAIVAGTIYAFAPYRLAHVPQIQLEAMEWIPLAFLSLHSFVERGGVKYAAALAACVVLQALCCVYYAVFLVTALPVAAAAIVVFDARARSPRRAATLLIASLIAAALLAPIIGEYVDVHVESGLERSIEEISLRSADLASYLASGAFVHRALGLPPVGAPHDYLFPGFAALALAAAGSAFAKARRVTAIYLLVGLSALAVSFGPHGVMGLSLYRPLYRLVPVYHGLRQVSRVGVLTLFAVAVVGAFGASALEQRLPRPVRAWKWAIVALLFLETLSTPLRADRPGGVVLRHAPATPAVYTWLAEQAGSFSVLELPLPHQGELWRNAPYVYWSTVHWHKLVNGYSGFAPPGYHSLWEIFRRFPNDLSRDALRVHHVRYVIVHWDAYTAVDRPLNMGAVSRTPWLRGAVRFPNTDVFEVLPSPPLLTRDTHHATEGLGPPGKH